MDIEPFSKCRNADVFELRLATPGQAHEIASLYVSTRRLAYAPFFPADVLDAMSVPVETERWSARIAEEAGTAIVAIDRSGAIAGFAHVSWQDDRHPATGEVEFMYVGTEYQGRGLGGLLMAEAEASLSAADLYDGVLWVYRDNTPARGFYERCGWHDDGARRASDSAQGLFLARYRKHLT